MSGKSDSNFSGLFGLWAWPIVNLFLGLSTRIGSGMAIRDKGTSQRRTSITEIRPTKEGGWAILEHNV